jgi:hypothetical protein
VTGIQLRCRGGRGDSHEYERWGLEASPVEGRIVRAGMILQSTKLVERLMIASSFYNNCLE